MQNKSEIKETTLTVADQIWKEIQNVELGLFSLPGQTVALHCKQVKIDPNKLYLTSNTQAVLPMLEAAIGGKYNVERSDKYFVISKK